MTRRLTKNRAKPILAKEYPSSEDEAIARSLVAILKGALETEYPAGGGCRTLRAAQPKSHGCVKAEFIVEPDLPASLRVGIFKEAGAYPAWVRFANQNRTVQPDIKKDIRGMSIKILGVEGEKLLVDEKEAKTQDFVMISHNVFPTKDATDFRDLMQATTRGSLAIFWFFFNPFNLHLRALKNLRAARQKHANPLEIQYWSTTPYLFGARAIKFSARPCLAKRSNIPAQPADNYLKEAMKRRLAQDEACFDFLIQFQTDPKKTPIEDAGRAWSESLSPFQKAATLRIPSQTFDSPEQMEFCNNLSFTPWHSLPEHRPLGGVNRARREVYRALSIFRHERNKAPRQEPGGMKPSQRVGDGKRHNL